MWSMAEREEFIRQNAIDAQAVRDREGMTTSPREADHYRRVVVEGDFTGIIRGWSRDGVHAPARKITGEVDPGGQQGAKPATVARREQGRMIGERPGKGGNGRYGTRKQQITVKPVSDKQQAWIDSMLEELDGERLEAAQQALQSLASKTGGRLTGGYGGSASQAIDILKIVTKAAREEARKATVVAAPARAPRTRREPLPSVPDGRYAVPNADGALRFYRVTNHKNGRVYVNVRASDAWCDVPFGAYAGILAKIAVDPVAAGKRYADELGRCYLCGRLLTDEESRAFGTGPDCGGRK